VPAPSPNVPNTVPVPESVPHPNTPKVPPGPTLRVMAWASGPEAKVLAAEADAFGTATGRRASLTVDSDEAGYRRDLRQALASGSPPDVCLISARDFSGLDPARELADATPAPESASRSIAAFTVNGHVKAAPVECSVDVLFYNRTHFDEAGIGYPDRHWNWDILEADARALGSLKLKDAAGEPVYPLELPADFDFWNILCTQAGHPALDLGVWHLGDVNTKESQMRALDFIHEIFQGLTVTAPLPKAGEPPGRYFARQRASLLIAPSEFAISLPNFSYAFTLLPRDMEQASLARVNGWAVTAQSTQTEAARELAGYLAYQPVHAGWSPVQKPAEDGTPAAICYEAMGQALVPRVEPKTAWMAQFLDQQINLLARNSEQNTDEVYARIQTEFQSGVMSGSSGDRSSATGPAPSPKLEAPTLLR
jgi:ABC-type glycerol-3-phosphate transport system substrate-binding protein